MHTFKAWNWDVTDPFEMVSLNIFASDTSNVATGWYLSECLFGLSYYCEMIHFRQKKAEEKECPYLQLA